MILAALLALLLSNALKRVQHSLADRSWYRACVFILRWFWWRVNAYSEITGMIVSFALALVFEFVELGLQDHEKLVLGVLITTLSWIIVTLLTRPTDTKTLVKFYNAITPYGRGWKPFRKKALQQNIKLSNSADRFTIDLASMLLGVVFVYTSLFATGYVIYGNMTGALVLIGIALLSGISIFALWRKSNKKR